MLDELISDLKADEGWRAHAYQDSLGYQTIGFGFLIDERRGGGLPLEIGEKWLRFLVADVWADLTSREPWIMGEHPDVQRALANMAYQMGVSGVLGFKNMLAALRSGDRERAAQEALESRWARQTPERAQRVAGLIRGAS